MSRSLVVKVTCGVEAPERANQGFMVASLAATSGVPVSLWLAGEAAWLASPEHRPEIALPRAVPLADLLDQLIEAGGRVTVCSQCAARRSLTEADLVDGARIAGAAVFVEEAMADGVQALVY